MPMGVQKAVEEAWDTVAIDFLGPFPRSKRGNRYLFVVVDVFSKFCLLKPMRQADTRSMVQFLENEVFLVYGVPSSVVSDNGPQFTSKFYKDLLKCYKITAKFNAAYHPQYNPAERVNRVVLASVRSYLKSNDHSRWDEEIPKIACAIRTAQHSSTGFSPYVVNFGRSMHIDGDRLPQSKNECTGGEKQKRMNEIRALVKKNLESAYGNYAKQYNLRSRAVSFEPGDIVLRKSFQQSRAVDYFIAKFASSFIKCRVREKIGAYTYLLESLDGKVQVRFHANDLLSFNAREY